VLVTIDTLRADRLGCYGYAGAATPVIDRLASEGALFTAASTVVPLTLPSHAAILTGRYPASIGVRNNGMYLLPPEETTLAEVLSAEGFATGAFIGSFVLAAPFGLSQGFDVYDEQFDMKRDGPTADERRAATVNEALFGWIEGAPRGPLFLWVHYFDPHARYEPPSPFDRQFAAAPYDGEIASVDGALGTLLERLERRAGRENLSVILTSDHGESLGEHGEATHGLFVYESTLHVPLILWSPGRIPAGVTVSEPVSVIDIFDTALELAGVDLPEGVPHSRASQGVSLLPLVGGGAVPRPLPVTFESWLPRLEFGWSELRGVRQGSLKLIDAPRPELFDLSTDRSEAHDLSGLRPGDRQRLHDALERSFSAQAASVLGSGARAMDDETVDRLRALGYVSAGTPVGAGTAEDLAVPGAGSLADPKDRLETHNRLKAAGEAIGQGPEGVAFALATLEELLREDPTSIAGLWRYSEALLVADRPKEVVDLLEPHLSGGAAYYWVPWLLGKARAALGEHEAALALMREAARRSPFFARRAVEIAALLREMGRIEESLTEARRALESAPADTALLELAADNARDLGRSGEAIELYEDLLRLSPGQITAAVSLSRLLLDAQRDGDAEDLLTRALEGSPDAVAARRLLGLVLMNRGALDEAAQQLSRANRDGPQNPETLYYLGLCESELGRFEEAERVIGALLRLAPDSPHSHRALGQLRAKQGRRGEAEVAYKRALSIDPTDPAAAQGLRQLSEH
jgi:arylsulfatase A-like enzyme/Flp pilus assembly protein TadD